MRPAKLEPVLSCARPDRDVPGITCGYPLPCPHHTLVIELTRDSPTLRIPLPRGTRLGDIVDALEGSAIMSTSRRKSKPARRAKKRGGR